MAQQIIGQGPGNLVPDTETRKFLASEAIDKGECVALVTESGALGYEVKLAVAANATIGIAAENIASGEWGDIIVGGYCGYTLGDSAIAAGDPISAHASTAGTCDTATLGAAVSIFGEALAADGDGSLATNYFPMLVFKRI